MLAAAVLRVGIGLAVVAVAGLALLDTERELGRARDLHGAQFRGAEACTRCHRDHAESFRRTYHRTMTREARGADLKAPFAGETVSYFGVPAHMERTPEGAPRMRYGGGSVPERTFEVLLTVGSRRYQQYIGRAGDTLVRLPWAYHLEEQRWFHMNGAFLTPDPSTSTPTSASSVVAADYERHVTRWNDNCIFCHNVGPKPGMRRDARGMEHFASSVEEHGVACEACHGPAAEHERKNQNPYRRYRLHLGDRADPTIVNPARLDPARSLDVCGRCHGQRITDDVDAFLRQGDRFVPGDDLALYSAPLWRDTPLHGEVGAFAARFWRDGTPRLTAYEYQGTLLSACATRGPLTCLDCHAMHAGDPRGQLRPELTRDGLCTQCHEDFVSAERARAHAHHADVRCVDCHMPPVVYGVMDSHVSHRIELPAPLQQGRLERPDACTLCHTDQTRAWAEAARETLWHGAAPMPRTEARFSQAETQLLGGDPVLRAVTAKALGRSPLGDRDRIRALLLDVMANDAYPGVRHLAWRALGAPSGYVPEGTTTERAEAVARLRAKAATYPLDAEAIAALRAQAADQALDIGE